MRVLTAIPIHNEADHVQAVLRQVRRYATDILVVDDGSTDGTAAILQAEPGIHVVTHSKNRGYGGALQTCFAETLRGPYDALVTLDCDGQHEPARIPLLVEAVHDVDIASGSRYLRDFRQDTPAPGDRQAINVRLTGEINARYGLNITDAFCGFKAYRREALEQLRITETGWGMPLQLWVQAARLGLTIREVGVPRLYIDPKRSFGATMDDPEVRLAYYRRILASAETDRLPTLPCAPMLPQWGEPIA